MSYEILKSDIVKDKQTIIEFWNMHNEKKIDKKFDWIYLSNPDGLATTWFIKHTDSSKIVGMASIFPRRFRFQGETFLAGIQGDFYIQNDHRTFGPALMLIRAIVNSLEDSDFDFLYAFPNGKADPIFKRAGYEHLGVTKKYTRLFDITRLLSVNTPIPSNLLELLSPITNQLLKLAYPDTWVFNLGRFKAHTTDTLNFDIEDFLNQYHENHFTTEKTAAYLKWKYEQDPDDKNCFFYITDRSGATKGVIVFCNEPSNIIQLRELLPSPDQVTRSALLALFFTQARKSRHEYAYAQFYEKSGLLTTTNNLDLTIGDKGRKIVYAVNPKRDSNKRLSKLINSNNFSLLKSDEDS